MKIVLLAAGAMTVTLIAQVVLWRLFRPARQYTALLGLFGAVLGAVLLAWQLSDPSAETALTLSSRLDRWFFSALYVAMTLAYFVTYPAAQAESPTLSILLRVHQAGPQGLRLSDLEQQLTDDILVIARLEDLLIHGMATRIGSRYVITPSGERFAWVHESYRAFLKMEVGG